MTQVLYPLPQKEFEYLMLDEGHSLTDDPDDNGGLTKYGVSQKFNPDVDVRNLTLEGARQVYEQRYWAQPGIQLLPKGIDYAVFDFGVNSGPERAIRSLLLQTSIGGATLSAATLGAVRGLCDRLGKAHVIDALCDERARFLLSLNQPKYTKGWLARVERVRRRAKERAGVR